MISVMINGVIRFENVLKQQEKLNAGNAFSTINRETGLLLYNLIKSKNPKNVIEIGTSIGYSSIWIASALSKSAKLITLERWHERAELAKKFFKKAKLTSSKVKLIEGDALQIIPKLKSKFDVVFIDATKKEYLAYLKKLIKHNKHKKLSKNCLIIADNTVSHAHKMQDFLSFAEKNNAITLNVGKGLTIFNI